MSHTRDVFRRLAMLGLALCVLIAGGTVAYALVEDRNVWDGFVWTVDTVATTGSIQAPQDPAGEVVKVALTFLGVGTLFYALVSLTELVVTGELGTLLSERRARKMTERLRDHYIVCGFGRVGRQVARDLRAAGALYVVIDEEPKNREAAYAPGVRFITARPSDDEALRDAGIARARAIVACVDSDAENIFIALTARELRPDIAIVARASREDNESKLRRAGADRVVTPDAIGGHRLALALLRPAVHDLFNEIFSFGIEVAVDVGQILIEPSSPFAGQTVAGCDLRRMRNVSILAIREPGGAFALNPDAERVVHPGETLIVIGPAQAVYELEAMYSGD